MTRRSRFQFTVCWLLVLAICLTIASAQEKRAGDFSRQDPDLVKESTFSGVIFPASMKAFRYQFPKDVRYWTPAHSDVLTAEHELFPFLQNSRDPKTPRIIKAFASYKRQYAGVILDGQKYLYLNLFCETYDHDWTHTEMIVLDGDTCYFNVRFNLKTKVFSDLQINGRA